VPPLIVHRQPPRQRPDLHARNGAALIAAHRIARDGQLRRDRLRAPPTIRQLTNRSHDLAFDHRHLRYGRYQNPLLSLHSTLLLRGSELVSQGGQYHCRSTTGCRRTLFLMSETICVPLCFFCGATHAVFPCVASVALPTACVLLCCFCGGYPRVCSSVLLLWRYSTERQWTERPVLLTGHMYRVYVDSPQGAP